MELNVQHGQLPSPNMTLQIGQVFEVQFVGGRPGEFALTPVDSDLPNIVFVARSRARCWLASSSFPFSHSSLLGHALLIAELVSAYSAHFSYQYVAI